MNRYAVMVDSSCNLPRDLIASLGILCIPNRVQIGGKLLIDTGDTAQATAFYSTGFDNGKVHAEIIPASPEDYLEMVKQHAILECDHLLLLTPQRNLSVLYQHANKGLVSIATASMEQRLKSGRKETMKVEIVDSQSVFSPHGLVAWEAALALREGLDMAETRARLSALAPQVHGYFVVDNVKYIYHRARDERDKPNALLFAVGNVMDIKPIVRRRQGQSDTVDKIRGFDAAVLKLLERIKRLIEDGQLTRPRVVVSYAGPLAELQTLPGYMALARSAHAAGTELALSVMSYSCGVFMGARALAIGLAAQEHPF
jgi:DegV family protein with EDD domain